jgi:hypothetical protein
MVNMGRVSWGDQRPAFMGKLTSGLPKSTLKKGVCLWFGLDRGSSGSAKTVWFIPASAPPLSLTRTDKEGVTWETNPGAGEAAWQQNPRNAEHSMEDHCIFLPSKSIFLKSKFWWEKLESSFFENIVQKKLEEFEMGNWIRFFIGTPQRFLRTFVGVGLVVVLVSPGLLGLAISRFLQEAGSLIGPLLWIGIVVAGIRILLFGRRKWTS